ncbi:hypothetical protein DESUT3_31590 [Desulfuromonas versatilis]|uniref:Rhodanese domain-containing protein n=1 Tax=Desulfuromonas versatilis TaxID=2802975 RepID=A0ABM8HZP1_9BACT|nr:selenite/tellurite reduction operon rhodanese-like protein ExtH [Desulfuromonas versatilis]BCR06090.1 hypothetical protein DESUT3_31590 [Desulfuromonas versatilis]
MKDRKFKGAKNRLSAWLGVLLAATLVISGCGSDSYDGPSTATNNPPVAGAATNVLVEAGTLKAWMDQGLLASDGSFDQKVVVLDFGAYAMNPAADPERIKGACRVGKNDLQATRFEGVADATPLVATGEQMDAVIQRLGIGDDTIIVFTTSSASYYATRAYWTFRYWGFPKERLKLLDGGNAAFAAAFPTLMTREVPVPSASTYSVRDLANLNPNLRASVGEMIEVLAALPTDDNLLLLDARGSKNYLGQGATPGLMGGDFVVVDGHPAGGQYLGQGELFDADGTFKTRAEIETLFSGKGWTPGKAVTVYCTSGYSATPLFFALDAVLDAPVQLYDGSWSQLGKYSDYTVASGQLPLSSSWAIDRYLDPATVRYNYRHLTTTSAGYAIETLKLDAAAEQIAPFTGDVLADDSDVNPLANQIEEADAAYVGSGVPVVFPAPVATATAPLAGQSQNVLIDAATLQGWIAGGLVNAPLGGERVVILDVTDSVSYRKGHIPGAVLWDISRHAELRTEGPAPAVNMVATGARMDELIQAAGIDEHTTIVITSSQTETYYPSRAYFLFRYYGFPRENLKVLNGYNGAWNQAALVSTTTAVTPSTFSVRDVANLQPDTRISLAELLDALRDGRGVPVDFRGVKTAAASTAGVFSEVAGDYVVFEGQLVGGKGYAWKGFNVNYGTDNTFKDAATIATALGGIGLDGTQLVYSYCRTGYIASAGFFVLDGILGWPVMTYDGSWSQFGKLSADATKGGELPAGSLWAADNGSYMSVITYNKDATRMQKIEALNADASTLNLLPSDPAANQVESSDEEYQTLPSGNEAPAGPPTSGGTGPSIGC